MSRLLVLLAVWLLPCVAWAESFPSTHLWVATTPSVAGMTQVHQRCTAFIQDASPDEVWVITARHCLHAKAQQFFLLHGFEGKLDDGGQFQHITQFNADSFVHSGSDEDVTWRRVLKSKVDHTDYLHPSQQAPVLGDALTVTGFPHAEGPFTYACVHEGFKLADEYGTLRMKAQMSCQVQGNTDLSGLSGASVLNAEGEVVGVFTSESLDAQHPQAGWAVYSYEPMVPSETMRPLDGTPLVQLRDGKHALANRLVGSQDGSIFTFTIVGGRLQGEVVHRTDQGDELGRIPVSNTTAYHQTLAGRNLP